MRNLISTPDDVWSALSKLDRHEVTGVGKSTQPPFDAILELVNLVTLKILQDGPQSIAWTPVFMDLGALAMTFTPDDFTPVARAEFAKLLLSKHAAYGPGSFKRWGELGAFVKISLKVDRIHNILSTGAPEHDESKLDNAKDIVGYVVLSLYYIQLNEA